VAQVYAMTGDMGEAQEAVQEAFVRAWSRWGRLADYENPAAWVRTVAQRIAVSRWRKARNAVRGWLRHGPPTELPGPDGHSVALVAALRLLPVPQQRALVLHHMAGRPVSEIAAQEGVAEGTVKARLARGRAALAAHLSEGSELWDDRELAGPLEAQPHA
jgi:RNA polymerase sigma-70 factor (ECF subfamily)